VFAAAGLVVAACSDDDVATDTVPVTVPTTATPATTQPPTTLPETTIPDTTAPATMEPPAPTTEPVSPSTAFVPGLPDERWTPPCVDQPALSASPAEDDPLLETFGPLGSVPALEIVLPLPSSTDESSQAPSARVERVPGGLALLVAPSTLSALDGGAFVTVVGHDGQVRWQRCLDPTGVVSSLLAGGSTLLVGTYAIETGEPSWMAFDPLTGGDMEPPSEIAGLSAYPYGDRYVLLRRPDIPGVESVVAAEDHMALFDRTTGTVEAIPYPATADGQSPGLLEFAFVGDTLVQRSNRVPIAVFDGEQWLTDGESLVSLVVPEAMTVPAGDVLVWVGRNGAGEELWRKPEWHDPMTEGFQSIATDGVTILRACKASDEAGLCTEGVFAGVETATGEVLWERPEQQAAMVAGDGFALVTRSDGRYAMIDARTGEPTDPSQEFLPGSFMQGCCGEDEVLWTARRGGLVAAVDYQNVNVWYPEAMTSATTTVHLLE
jgi:hypothetical protein